MNTSHAITPKMDAAIGPTGTSDFNDSFSMVVNSDHLVVRLDIPSFKIRRRFPRMISIRENNLGGLYESQDGNEREDRQNREHCDHGDIFLCGVHSWTVDYSIQQHT